MTHAASPSGQAAFSPPKPANRRTSHETDASPTPVSAALFGIAARIPESAIRFGTRLTMTRPEARPCGAPFSAGVATEDELWPDVGEVAPVRKRCAPIGARATSYRCRLVPARGEEVRGEQEGEGDDQEDEQPSAETEPRAGREGADNDGEREEGDQQAEERPHSWQTFPRRQIVLSPLDSASIGRLRPECADRDQIARADGYLVQHHR